MRIPNSSTGVTSMLAVLCPADVGTIAHSGMRIIPYKCADSRPQVAVAILLHKHLSLPKV
jgi:hypothetical protein